MSNYDIYAPKKINVKVITAAYDEDLEMKMTSFFQNEIDENSAILDIHYTDNVTTGKRMLSAIITYVLEEF